MSESLTLLEESQKPNALHYLALISVTLFKFGDSVEFFLPAVITQPVSCELGLTKTQENMLALALYISAAVFSIFTIPFLKKYPRRPIILFSLYLSILATIFCAVVASFVTLLISRLLIGFTIAISMSPLSVYISEISPNKKFYVQATLSASIGWIVGGGWCGVLGYLFLEKLGWRLFLLLTSIPVFLPPLLAFQFFLPETKESSAECLNRNECALEEAVKTPKLAMISRILKLQLFNMCRIIPFSGATLLVPSMMKIENIKSDDRSPCNAIHGIQFLSITLLFGACRLLGVGLGYIFHNRKIRPAVTFTLSSVFVVAAFGYMVIFTDEITGNLFCMSCVQVMLSVCGIELDVLSYDKYFFTNSFLPISSGLRLGISFLVGLLANTVSETLPFLLVLKINLGVSFVGIFSCLLFCIQD